LLQKAQDDSIALTALSGALITEATEILRLPHHIQLHRVVDTDMRIRMGPYDLFQPTTVRQALAKYRPLLCLRDVLKTPILASNGFKSRSLRCAASPYLADRHGLFLKLLRTP